MAGGGSVLSQGCVLCLFVSLALSLSLSLCLSLLLSLTLSPHTVEINLTSELWNKQKERLLQHVLAQEQHSEIHRSRMSLGTPVKIDR